MTFKRLWKKTLLTMVAFAFIFMMGNVALASGPEQVGDVENTKGVKAPTGFVTSINQTDASETSITLQWNAATGATGYRIYYGKKDTVLDKYVEVNGSTTCKITNLSKDAYYNFRIYAYAKEGSQQVLGYYRDYSNVRTLPTKITGIKYADYYLYAGGQYFTYNKKETASSIEYQIWNAKGKKVSSGVVSPYASNKASKDCIYFSTNKIKTNQYYKIKLRGIIYMNGSKKKAGAWSDSVWFGKGPMVKSVTRSGSGVKVKWEKVAGAKNYTVYISNKKTSGYKKVKTTTKNYITINKYKNKALKSKTDYWVRIVANKKVGSKTIKSSSFFAWNFRYYK